MQSHHFTCESLLVSGTHNTSLQSFRARSLAQEYLVNYPPCTKPYTNNFLVVLTLGKNSSLLPWRVLSPIVSKGFRNDWQIRICQLSKCLVDFRGRPFDSWGVYGWFQKKNPADWFRWEKSLQGNSWEKEYPTLKKKTKLVTYQKLKKNISPLYVGEKISNSRGWRKNCYPN